MFEVATQGALQAPERHVTKHTGVSYTRLSASIHQVSDRTLVAQSGSKNGEASPNEILRKFPGEAGGVNDSEAM